MALESATYIDGLVVTNPLGSDPLAGADDHLRLIKSTLKSTFPNITGPVTATQGELSAPLPVGGIIIWSGAIADVPSGWLLCDGGSGTPDLRDRFVVGAGLGYAVAATGGEATVALATANLPVHSHPFSGSGTTGDGGAHTHSVTDPGHVHPYTVVTNRNGGGGGNDQYTNTTTANTVSAFTGISLVGAPNHTHPVTVSGTTGDTGSGTAHENRPPYYALAYIMKT